MKKILLAGLMLVLPLLSGVPTAKAQAPAAAPAASAAQTSAPAAPAGRKKRVAIFDFDYATVQTSSSAVFGTNVDIGRGITDLLPPLALALSLAAAAPSHHHCSPPPGRPSPDPQNSSEIRRELP